MPRGSGRQRWPRPTRPDRWSARRRGRRRGGRCGACAAGCRARSRRPPRRRPRRVRPWSAVTSWATDVTVSGLAVRAAGSVAVVAPGCVGALGGGALRRRGLTSGVTALRRLARRRAGLAPASSPAGCSPADAAGAVAAVSAAAVSASSPSGSCAAPAPVPPLWRFLISLMRSPRRMPAVSTPSVPASSRSSASTMPDTPPRRRRSVPPEPDVGASFPPGASEAEAVSVERTSVSVTQVLPDRPGPYCPGQRTCPHGWSSRVRCHHDVDDPRDHSRGSASRKHDARRNIRSQRPRGAARDRTHRSRQMRAGAGKTVPGIRDVAPARITLVAVVAHGNPTRHERQQPGGHGAPGGAGAQPVTTAPSTSTGSGSIVKPAVGRSSGSCSPVVSASTVGPAPDTTAGTPASRSASTSAAVAG